MQKKEDSTNLGLWESVDTTDPEFTTKVNKRGGFTAIGAQYQLKNATSLFGPFGLGFGVKNELYTPILNDTLIVYTATFFYKWDGVEGAFPISSSIKVIMGSRVDDDCIKKVATDALTKGLSKLGFNADVFMGRFDDNKYVDASGQKLGVDTADTKDGWV